MSPLFYFYLSSGVALANPISNTEQTWLAILEFTSESPISHTLDIGLLRDATTTHALHHIDPEQVSLMTRENMMVLIDANNVDLDCIEGQCEVETGRNLGADWVISGSIHIADPDYFLYFKLHNTHTGRLINALEVSGLSQDDLIANIPNAVFELLTPLPTYKALELTSTMISAQSSVMGCNGKRLQESIALWTTVLHMEDVACLPNTSPLSITSIDYDLEVLIHPLTESEVQELIHTNESTSSNIPYASASWLEAVEIANHLSQRQGLQPCYTIHGEKVTWVTGIECPGWRLPTETEWELFMRAGNTEPVWSGQHKDAWDNPSTKHLPVCSTTGNTFGICDIVDNTWEWTWDWYGPYTTVSKVNYAGPTNGTQKVIRNGRHRRGLSVQSPPQKPTSIRLVRSIQGK